LDGLGLCGPGARPRPVGRAARAEGGWLAAIPFAKALCRKTMVSSPTSRQRRKEVRRQRAAGEPSRLGSWRARYGLWPVLIGLFVCVASTAIILSGEMLVWQIDETAPADLDIRARVPFTVTDQKLTEDNRRKARLNAPDVYVRNEAVLSSIGGKLRDLFALAKSSEDAAAFVAAAQAKHREWSLDDGDYRALKAIAVDASGAGAGLFEMTVTTLNEFLANQFIVHKPNDPQRPEAPLTSLLTWNDSGRRTVLTSQLQYVSDSQAVRRIAEEAAQRLPAPLEPLRPDVTALIIRSLQPGPNQFEPIYRYDQQATADLMKQYEAAVQPVVYQYKPGDVLVKAGQRIGVEDMELLRTEHEAYRAALRLDFDLWRRHLLTRAGLAALVFLVVMGLGVYTHHYQQRNLLKPSRTLGISALMLLTLGLARLGVLSSWSAAVPRESAVALVVIAAAICTIAYEQRYALGLSGALAILVTLAIGGDLALFVTLLVPMGATIFLLRDIRTRGKLILTGFLAGLAAFVAAAAGGLVEQQDLRYYVLPHAVAAASSGLFAGFIVLGVLPAIERLFGVATSLTLLEWCDASRPLLRRLAQEAPGTHTHSLMMGTLAEAAANAIGANGLLARVGALYHDIGKISKPAYYVENQEARINRHDRLGPTLSLLVIVAHVKDGLELARRYGLPRILHQFITEHHGTTVVRYFQRMAAEQAQRARTRELPESEFRYPGPKPRSKETAILMICDGVEGAVRALPEATPGRIEQTVHQVLMERLHDGQFDECDITLKELSRVEETLVKGLCAIYHARIAYPKAERKEPSARSGETAGEVRREHTAEAAPVAALARGSAPERSPR